MQKFDIYDLNKSDDKLILMPDGHLKHLIKDHHMHEEHNDYDDDFIHKEDMYHSSPFQYEYEQGKYCMDTAVSTNGHYAIYASVCNPHREVSWTDADFMIRKIINPVCHGLSMIVLLVVAIVYFVLPTLR